MRTAFVQRATSFFMVALIGMSMGGTSVSAQTPTPEPPQPTARQVGSIADEPEYPASTPEPTEGLGIVQEETALPSPDESTNEAIDSDLDNTTSSTEMVEPPTTANGVGSANFNTNAATPSIIDVSTPNGVVAGDIITYTYTFTNTISDGDFYVQAWWLNYSPTSGGNSQYCEDKTEPKNCDAIPETAYQLPSKALLSIVRETCPPGVTPTNSTCYLVKGLPRSQKGQFQVRLRTKASLYPKTNASITTLSGSASLLQKGTTTGQGQDTAATLVVGPVLAATKTPVTTGTIYTGDQGTFKISVGNATGTKDSSNGTIRADARTATNILVIDPIPTGSAFVSSNQQAYQQPFDPTKDKEIKWLFPGPLKPGEKLPDIQVVFKKVGGTSTECTALRNPTIKLTSKEYPLTNGANTIISANVNASIPVVSALVVKKPVSSSTSIPFGEVGDISITVQNYKPVAINNVTLTYKFQTGFTFVQATPKETSNDQATPPTISWVFNIAAGSITQPKEMTFVVKMRAGFSTTTSDSLTTLTAPSQAIDCNTQILRVSIVERLTISKAEGDNPYEIYNKVSILPGPGEFEYVVTVTNNGKEDVSDIEITDKLPSGDGAGAGTGKFSYVPDSAEDKETGIEYPPSEITDETIKWSHLSVDAGSSIHISYKLRADGDNYVRYCNSVSAIAYHEGQESEEVKGLGTVVCLRLNPPLDFEKTADKYIVSMDEDGDTPIANRTVTFKLTAINNGAVGYPLGFVDDFPPGMDYVEGSTTATPATLGGEPIISGNYLVWENNFPGGAVPTIAPGEKFTLEFKAIVPEGCESDGTTSYKNKLRFRDNKYLVIIDPVPTAEIIANCGKIDASVAPEVKTVSLGNEQNFVVTLKNTSQTAAETNLPVEVRMPSGYTYVGINTGSSVTTAPTSTISGTFTTLKWTVPSIGKSGTSDATKTIKFKARAGITVLPDNLNDGIWTRAVRNGQCTKGCITDPVGGAVWSAAAVKVDTLITLSSKFTETGCAEVNTTRTYELTVSNTHEKLDYTSTTITVTLPLGIEYVAKGSTTPTPSINTIDGKQTLIWTNQTIGKKNGAATTKLYSLSLKVTGKGGGALSVSAIATSPVGAFPPRTGVVDPTVFICMSKPGLWFNSAPVSALPGQTATFEIQATNPMSASYGLGFEYTIPDQLEYVTSTADLENPTYVEPEINGNVLSWPSVTLPAAENTSTYGQMVIHFKLKIKDDAALGTKITNKLKVTKNIASTSSMPLVEIKNDTTYLFVMRSFYLPVILR